MKRTPNKFERREASGAVLKAGDDRRVRFLASDATPDRHGTIIIPGGIKTENFTKNPAFIWSHQSGGIFTSCDPDDVIGRVAEFEVTDKGFEITAEFAPADVNPKAERCYRAVQGQFLNAVSIGFAPIKYHFEERDGGDILIFDEVDLLEVSLVILGSNPEALALRSLFSTEKDDMKRKLALKKLNLSEGAKAAEIRTAKDAYLLATDDDKATRAAVARAADEACREAEDKEKEERGEGEDDEDKDEGEEKEDRGEGDEDKDKDDDKDDDDEKRATERALAWTQQALQEARKEAPKERAAVERVDLLIKEGRVPRAERDEAIKLERRGKLERTVEKIPRGTFTTAQRLRGGQIGTPVDPPERRPSQRGAAAEQATADAKRIREESDRVLKAQTRGLS